MPKPRNRWMKKLATSHSSLHAKRLTTLLVGAALSVGGTSEAFNGVHFTIEKELDSVRVIRRKGDQEATIARLEGKYTSNSVFKLARVLPDRFVTQKTSLFHPEWFPAPTIDLEALAEPATAPVQAVKSLAQEFSIISGAIQEEFFKTIPFGELIQRSSEKYNVDPLLVAAIMEQESRFKPRARSPVGARGLMQLMPRTGYWMGARNLYDPAENVDAGVKYLKYLDKRFNGDTKKVIAAYNAGEGNVMRYRGTPPFRETRIYLRNVTRNYEKRQRQLAAFAETR
jgi:soluble lytic murein transglycosylase-like protein